VTSLALNPFSYTFHEDPYPTYKRLRDEDPCHHNEALGFWALTRYTDVLEASRDWETFSSADGPMIEKIDREFFELLPMMISLDPPRHDELRSLVSRVFTPRRIAGLEDAVRTIAGRYLDELVEKGGGDFVGEFSALLPMDVIFTLLGVPEEDRRELRRLADVSLERDDNDPGIPQRALDANAKSVGYWFERAAHLRANRGDDFISHLIDADLTDAEVAGFCGLIGGAGTETVTKLLANACVLLTRHPDQRQLLLDDSSLIPGAVEETLRYLPPSQYQGRTATCDVEKHGRTIPAGSRVIVVTGAANRDERAYPDPDTYDILRKPDQQPLSLGHGVHFCLGAALARLEGRIGIEEFLRRFPAYDIDESGLQRVHMSNVHGFEHVPFSAS
jgi:cytochrome P450